nr:hypothetical protein [Oenococcus oeni]
MICFVFALVASTLGVFNL